MPNITRAGRTTRGHKLTAHSSRANAPKAKQPVADKERGVWLVGPPDFDQQKWFKTFASKVKRHGSLSITEPNVPRRGPALTVLDLRVRGGKEVQRSLKAMIKEAHSKRVSVSPVSASTDQRESSIQPSTANQGATRPVESHAPESRGSVPTAE